MAGKGIRFNLRAPAANLRPRTRRGQRLLGDYSRLLAGVRTLDEDAVDDHIPTQHAARQMRSQLPCRLVRHGAGQLDEAAAQCEDCEFQVPRRRVAFENVEQLVLDPLGILVRRLFVVAGTQSPHRAPYATRTHVAHQPSGDEPEQQPGTKADRACECDAKPATRFSSAPLQRPSHGPGVRAKLNSPNNVRTRRLYQRMTSERPAYLSRKPLIQSVIVAVLVLGGLALFFVFGNTPKPLLESSIPGLG